MKCSKKKCGLTRVRLWQHGRWQECDCDNMEDDKSATVTTWKMTQDDGQVIHIWRLCYVDDSAWGGFDDE
jgi:hypothetical protein